VEPGRKRRRFGRRIASDRAFGPQARITSGSKPTCRGRSKHRIGIFRSWDHSRRSTSGLPACLRQPVFCRFASSANEALSKKASVSITMSAKWRADRLRRTFWALAHAPALPMALAAPSEAFVEQWKPSSKGLNHRFCLAEKLEKRLHFPAKEEDHSGRRGRWRTSADAAS
jgi:hypothetical protein